jgi:hypothetical protein
MEFREPVQNVDLRNAQLSNVGGNQYNNLNVYQTTNDKTLTVLKPAIRSGHHVPRCMERTRESVLEEVNRWLDGMYNTSGSRVLRVVHVCNPVLSERQYEFDLP